MAGLDDLKKDNEYRQIWAAIHEIRYATNLNRASLGRGGLRVHSGGVITIENGGLDITGTATISGLLDVTGTTRFTGQTDIWGPLIVTGDTDLDGVTTITGDTTVTGNFDVNGPMKTTGTLDVEGITTLKSDLNVTGTGKIKVGTMTLDPGLQGGAISFGNGAQVFTDANSIQLFKGTSVVQIEDGMARLQGTGGDYIQVDSAGAKVSGDLDAQDGILLGGLPDAPPEAKANLYWDPTDRRVKFVTSP